MWDDTGYGWTMMNQGPGWGVVVLLLVLVLVVTVPLVAYLTAQVLQRRDDPQKILRERLARGEISEEDYESRRSVLGSR